MAEESRSTMCSINGKEFRLWINPDGSSLKQTPELLRFANDGIRGKVFVCDYSCAMHTDMSVFLELNDCHSS